MNPLKDSFLSHFITCVQRGARLVSLTFFLLVLPNLLIAQVMPPPVIQSGILQGNTFALSFPSATGRVYVLQYTADLTPPASWHSLGAVDGNGSLMTLEDVGASGPSRYYRLVIRYAPSTIYSLNAVGYVRRVMLPGTNLVATPLIPGNGDYSIGSLFPNCPEGSAIIKIGNTDRDQSVFSGGAWNPAYLALYPGDGAILVNPSAPFEIAFAGDVPQGTRSTTIPSGMSLKSSIAPVNGLLNFPAQNDDMIRTWNATNQTYVDYYYFDGDWYDSEWWPVTSPVIRTGEAFWVMTGHSSTWTQQFDLWSGLDYGEPAVPVITSPPSSRTVIQGATARFTALGIGSLPLTYQWRQDGTNLLDLGRVSGANTYTLVISNCQPADAGIYSLVVSNANGQAASSNVTLTVVELPVIIQQPQSQTHLAGATAVFSATAVSSKPLSYQWRFNGTNLVDVGNISGVTTTNLTIANVQLADAGNYSVVVTNQNGSVTSSVAALTVVMPPLITTQPASQGGIAGGPVRLSVAVAGTGPFTYQWQVNGTNLPNNPITTVAGRPMLGDGGPATNASIHRPYGLTADAAGNLYIADSYDNRIRKIDANGVINTIAGDGSWRNERDGVAAISNSVVQPLSVAVDSYGNVFVNETWRIRKVDTYGVIRAFAGNGYSGYSGEGGAATNASLGQAQGIALDSSGNLLIAHWANHRICRVGTNGIITTIAGNGTGGFSGDGGFASNATVNYPQSVAVDNARNVFFADSYNHRIRKISNGGIITTVAGNGINWYSGDGGMATNASLSLPGGVAVDLVGNLFISDNYNNRVRKVGTDGIIRTVAGNGSTGYSGDGGAATNAGLLHPSGLVIDSLGNLFIADTGHNCLRKVDTNGIITTVTGGWIGDGGAATNADIVEPEGIAVDAVGNLFIAERNRHRIRKTGVDGIITTVSGTGDFGFSGDGGASANAKLYYPEDVAVDAVGNLLIADGFNNRIRLVNPAGVITTVAGNGAYGYSGDGNAATNATLFSPNGVAVDSAGNVLIADSSNNRVRLVNSAGIISTITGSDIHGFAGDGGPAANAKLDYPAAVASDNAGNVFIADSQNHRIRKVSAGGTITTVAGNGAAESAGDGGLATSAGLAYPSSVATDAQGNLFIAQSGNRIRQVAPNGYIKTLAGDSRYGFSGDGGSATNASLFMPSRVAADASGNIFIADTLNHCIRAIWLTDSPVLSLNNVNSSNAGDYQVVITSPYGSVTSSVAAVTIAGPPVITTQPVSQTNTLGSTLSLSVTASGTPPLSYRWRFNDIALSDGGKVSGATATNLTITSLDFADAGSYSVVVSNSFGSVTSSVAVLTVQGIDNSYTNYTYTTNNGSITITAYTGPGGAATIPAIINGLAVTAIGNQAFYYNSSLTSITIPDSVITIGNSAFDTCTSLTNIIIGQNVTSIGRFAFNQCIKLTAVILPNSVTNIGDFAFQSCSSLTGIDLSSNISAIGDGAFANCFALAAITVDPGNPTYLSVAGVVFNHSQTTLCVYPGGKVGTSYTIPGSVTTVGNYAFWGCRLANITIPDSVATIGNGAFGGCSSLAEITLPNSVASIGQSAFFNCLGLTSIAIPNSVTQIGHHAFQYCNSLTNATIGVGVTNIGVSAFGACASLRTIVVEAQNSWYSSVNGVLFDKGQTTLLQFPAGLGGNYTLPGGITSVGVQAFDSCVNLVSVTIPGSVASIGESAFWQCLDLSGLYFLGAPPVLGGSYVFFGDDQATVYYLPGTAGWGATYGGLPTMPWNVCLSVTAIQTNSAMGAPLAFHIQSFDCATSNAIPNVTAVVWITTAGTTRTNHVTTDAAGQATCYFEPLAGEAGHYEFSAGLPGQAAPPPEGRFAIVGIGFATNEVSHRLIVGRPVTNHIEIRNLTDVPLTGITVEFLDPPPGVTFQASTPSTLEAFGTNTLTYILKATAGGEDPVSRLRVTSSEGAVNELPVTVAIVPPVPQLVATPASLVASMFRGEQTLVQLQLVNLGGAPANDVRVMLPEQAPWLSVVSNPRIASLGAGESTTVTLALTPAPDLPLGPYRRQILLHSVEVDLTLPCDFTCASALAGDLRVEVVDEFTYFSPGAPRVTNATVTVKEYWTGTNVATGVTGPGGSVLFTNLSAGYYDIDVRADKHGGFSTTFLVASTQTNELVAFLSRETVSYNWVVLPTEDPDHYDIQLETVFEVAVPWPTVTIDPPDLNLCNFADGVHDVNLTITNHGLITAAGLRLAFPAHPAWEITLLTGNLGDLPARSSKVVPIRIRRTAPHGDVPSRMDGRLDYSFTGDNLVFPRSLSLPVWNANAWDCVAPPWISIEPATLDMCSFADSQSVDFTIRNHGTMDVAATVFEFDSHVHWQIQPAVANLGTLPAQSTRVVSVLFTKVPSLTSGPSTIEGRVSYQATLQGGTRRFLRTSKLHNPNPWDCVPQPLVTIQPASLDMCGLAPETSVNFTIHNQGPVRTEAMSLSFPAHPHWQIQPLATQLAPLDPQTTHVVTVLFRKISSPVDGPSTIPGQLNYQATVQGETRSFSPEVPLYRANAWDCVPQPPVIIEPNLINLCHLRALTNPITFTIHNRSAVSAEGTQLVFDNTHPHWQFLPPLTNLGILNPYSTTQVVVDFVQIPTTTNGSRNISAHLDYRATVEVQPRDFSVPVSILNANDIDCVAPPGGGGGDWGGWPQDYRYVHVRGKLLFQQVVTVSRNTFTASLELINNSSTSPLSLVSINLQLLDATGAPATNRFGVSLPQLTGLTAIDGTGLLDTNSSGTVVWKIIPATNAAPNGPTIYTVGGEVTFMQDGVPLKIPLYPVPITVLPDPRLCLDYFWEKTAYSDDALTPPIEPTVPFAVGLIMRNEGQGTARSVQVETMQPRIVENKSGLLISFNLLSAQIGNQPVPPNIQLNLGDLPPASATEAIWWMTSSLLADFIEYKATFSHLDDLGQRNLSLIDSVRLHPTLHVVRADVPTDDLLPDFLALDAFPTNPLPDKLYLSDGSVLPVTALTSGTIDGPPTPLHTNVLLTIPAPLPSGWVYLRIPDPAPGLSPSFVKRSDGRDLLLDWNVWTTFRIVYPTNDNPYVESFLHILDRDTTGSYTLGYAVSLAIVHQPLSRTNLAGTTATFSVDANGTAPLAYQWLKFGTNLAGQTNAILTLTNVQASDEAPYTVMISNVLGTLTSSVATLTVWAPPWISAQPQSQTNLLGTTATFSVAAEGTAPLSYQWFKNGASLPGQTGATLVIPGVQAADEGLYSVVVTNIVGAVTSVEVPLVIWERPHITVQPLDRTNSLGTTALFTVVATGADPLVYLWSKGGQSLVDSARIFGATSATLTLSNVQPGDMGNYSVLITNSYGLAQSRSARLSVVVSTNEPAGGLVAYYPLDGNALDASGNGNHGTMHGVVAASNRLGVASGSCYFDGNASYISAPADNLPATNRTVSLWFQADRVDAPRALMGYGGSGSGVGDSYLLGLNLGGSGGFTLASHYSGFYHIVPYAEPPVEQWHHWVAVMDESESRFFLDGELIGSKTGNTRTYVSGKWLALGSVPDGFGMVPYTDSNIGFFIGFLDEVRIYNRALSEMEVLALYWLDSEPDAPVIVTPPQSQTNVIGTTATFTVGANGTPPLRYQWRFNGSPLVGATNSTYSIVSVAPNHQGSYDVVVTNLYGSATSEPPALLLTVELPVIITQPQSRTNALGTTATFVVTATGTAPLRYHWLKGNETLGDSNRISGAATPMLTVSDIQAGDVGDYSVIVANDYGTIRSERARLYVSGYTNDLLTGLVAYYPLNGDARDASGNENHGTMFDVAPAADRFGVESGSCYFAGNYNYITAAADNLPSSQRTVSLWFKADRVDTRPGLMGYGGSGVGDSFILGLNHWGDNSFVLASHYWNYILEVPYAEPPVNQWHHWAVVMDDSGSRFYLDGEMIGSRTGTTQTYVPGTSLVLGSIPNSLGSGPYTDFNVGFFTGCLDEVCIYDRPLSESEVLALCWLGLEGQGPAIISQPQSRTNIVGTLATFAVTASGTPPLRYQWNFNGLPLAGATDSSYGIVSVQTNQAGLYSVVVTNGFGVALSSNAVLTVNMPVFESRIINVDATVHGDNPTDPRIQIALPAGQWMVTPVNPNLDGSALFTAWRAWSTGPWTWSLAVYGGSGTVLLGVLDEWYPSAEEAFTARLAEGPFSFVLPEPDTVDFRLLDKILTDNSGGVSFRLEPYDPSNQPPRIISQPQDSTNLLGSSVTFSVNAGGTLPLSYQWRFNGNPLAGATESAYAIANVLTTHAGQYSVSVTNVVGSVESRQAALLVLTSPRICPVADQVATVGRLLALTNCTQMMVPPITFRLNPPGPAGASLSPDGVFRWTPQCDQGGTTNLITLWAADSGGQASNSLTFTVTVLECLEMGLGNGAMQAGHTNSVQVRLSSPMALTNLAFTVAYPAERLTNFALSVEASQVITQNVSYLQAGEVRVSYSLPSTSASQGPATIGHLGFTAFQNQSSAFVLLAVKDVTGLTTDGRMVANASGSPGRMVLIGQEPLLEFWPSIGPRRTVRVYGNPGHGHVLEWKANLFDTSWESGPSLPLTNLWQDIEVPDNAPSLFFRAYKQ